MMTGQKGWPGLNHGFTLIEVMIVLAIVAILSAIALPSYSDYVLRSKLPEAFSTLSDLRIKLEQYYQDNSRYADAAAGTTCGIAMPTGKYFTYTCAAVDDGGTQTYTLTATGKDSVSGFTYKVTDTNAKSTTATSWGITSDSCWIAKKGGECY
ncbi:type IV pilin protein [Niveibacterium terrae]|uniref:type IV pilin protein n=1 Tax=Niveibacterium terrae TaxID=3373598 RepID=UPI003A92E1FA